MVLLGFLLVEDKMLLLEETDADDGLLLLGELPVDDDELLLVGVLADEELLLPPLLEDEGAPVEDAALLGTATALLPKPPASRYQFAGGSPIHSPTVTRR